MQVQKSEAAARERERLLYKSRIHADSLYKESLSSDIIDLEKENKKLARKTGLMGGVIVVLSVIASIVALK